MNILDTIKEAMKTQGIDEKVINKLLYEDAIAVLVKTDLPNADMMSSNKSDESATNTSAIAITTNAMNIFMDDKIVCLQSEENCKKTNYVENIVLLKQNLDAIKRDYTGNDLKIDSEFIDCKAHVGLHYKSLAKNQMYIGRIKDDDVEFTYFRRLLLKGDTLVILKLIDNKFCALGFPAELFEGIKKYTYEELRPVDDDEEESFYSTISKTDYDELEFTEDTYEDKQEDIRNSDIDLDAYENGSVDIDTTKECLRDLAQSNNIRLIRKNRHDRLVAYFGRFIESRGYSAKKNQAVDLLFKKDDDTVVLCEMKTLNGRNADLRSQSMKAFSQLYYYKMYKLGEYANADNVKLAVVFENKISKRYIEFFEENGIVVFWNNSDTKEDIQGTDKAMSLFV